MAADDRYTIPGSGGVLKNKLGLTSQDRLDRAMNESATRRWSIMVRESIPDQLDLDYLTTIHRRLLSPVLTWAGEMRRFGDEVIAGGTGIVYARSEFFRNGLKDVFGQLASEDYLRDLNPREFTNLLADRWGYLTTIHPFRDGNTRSQSAYVDRLAVRAGHPIDWPQVDVPTLRSLRLSAMTGSERPLANYLYDRLAPQNSADFTDAHSANVFAKSDAAIQPDTPSQQTGLSASQSDLDERRRRFPELDINDHNSPEADASEGLGL
ncbi:Fic/DOC family protein [Cryobacterium luteum]|uniref:protein adenylyltransferase n=1 Tax=Cryobacterium luteum TaxID=1424661 RepID=A0A1H8L0Z9_9MICO|nr:Fic family protein [Cryobacterium luteum]TFB82344.1 cell filamentation protein [Cryobacterium luteum]SEN98771.1 cell filamentation protein [Cryobacterium luteum]